MSRERVKNVYSQLNEYKVGARKHNSEGERIWVAYLTMEKVGLVGQMDYVSEKLIVEYKGKGELLHSVVRRQRDREVRATPSAHLGSIASSEGGREPPGNSAGPRRRRGGPMPSRRFVARTTCS